MTTFARLLAESLDFDDEYGNGLTNHEPMALTALERVRAAADLGDDVLDQFCAAYRRHLRPLAANAPPPAVARYADELARHGWERVVRDELTRLGDALPAAAGHGLLRVYFALEARPDLPAPTFAAELARGLGYFDSKQLRLYAGSRGEDALVDVLRSLPGLAPEERGHYGNNLMITERQARVSAHPQFLAAVRAIAPPAQLLPALAALSAMAVEKPDFLLLHAITTGQALVELEHLLPGFDAAPLQRGWVDFVVAAFLTQGLRVVERPATIPHARTVDGAQVQHLAAAGMDHGLKITFSLWRLEQLSGDPMFYAAARSFVRQP